MTDEAKIREAFEAWWDGKYNEHFSGVVKSFACRGFEAGYSARPESEAERVLREYGEAKKVVVELASKLVSDKNADEQFGKALKDMENLARKLAGGGE